MAEVWTLLSENALPLLDILAVAVVFYYLLLLVRGLKNPALFQSLAALVLVYLICQQFRLFTLSFVVERLLLAGPLVLVVVFAPEIRKFFSQLGKDSRFWRDFLPPATPERSKDAFGVGVVVDAVEQFAAQRTGALIVLELDDPVGELAISGTEMDALLSEKLLQSVFDKHNPLHDGAVLIRNGRLDQAGCFLPISESPRLPGHLGTRHRAALGLSERCDAIVAVVSEERRSLSIAHRGRIALDLTLEQFREQLTALTAGSESVATLTPRMELA